MSPAADGRARRTLALGGVLAALFVLALAYPTHLRRVGGYWTESDFYGRYAPDADRLMAGRFPADTVSAPGYPLLLVLLFPVTGDHFVSGKWLALVAAAATALLASRLFQRLFGAREALLAPLFLLVSGEFTKFSVQATTDLPFVLVCVGAMYVLVGGDRSTLTRAALAGVLSGMAYLIRYNGAFLVPVGLAAALLLGGGTRAGRLARAGAYALAFLAVVSPWLWLNHSHHGSPLYSTSYRDVATLYWGNSTGFTSIRDVIARDPGGFAVRYVHLAATNIGRSLGASFAVLPVGGLALLGAVVCVARTPAGPVVVFLLSVLACFLVLTLMHWETRYYFYAVVCYVGLAAHAIVSLVDWFRQRHRVSVALTRVLLVAMVLAIVVPSLNRSYGRLSRVMGGEPTEVIGASDYLRGAGATGTTVMAFKPHVAYLSRARWTRLPGVGSADALRDVLRERPADWVVYDRMAERYVPGLRGLGRPHQSPPWLVPVYADRPGNLVIYQVRPDRG